MKEYKTNLQSLLLSYYVKYNKLQVITDSVFANKDYTNIDFVDVYVDLYDMLLPIYTTNIYSDKSFVITSSIINLAAHIRQFYWSRYKLNTRIYFVYADESTINHKQFYTSFGTSDIKQMLNYQRVNDIIEDQLKLVHILCGYIYGVYYVRRTCDFSVFVYNNINKSNNIPSIIFTKSVYAYQIPAMLNNAVIIRPKKVRGEDNSFGINTDTVISTFCKNINRDDLVKKLSLINSQLMSVIMVLTSLPSKKVNSLFSGTTAINKIYNAISSNKIINGYNSDIDYLYSQLDIINKIDNMTFKYRFNAIDIVFQNRLYSNMAEAIDISHIIDLNDREAMHNINNKYFTDNPLDLEWL